MKLYKKINNITGWILFAIASAVYIITSEATASYWDCGEYIATAFKLQVGHPPGAPLFQMIGRFFSLFAFGNTAMVARMVNTMSALASGFTILFLFWTITRLAKKIVVKNGEFPIEKIIAIIGSGIVGALAYTFSDSFWFSAVEGEVYAMSSFFTAFVFWAILKWEDVYDSPEGLRWIILIAFMIGLSVGVHLLNLLALPSITLVYYFKKNKATVKGVIIAFIVSIIILALIMFVLIPGLVSMAGNFERFFINTFGLPFNSGTVIYGMTVTGLLVWGILYTHKKGKVLLNTALLSLVFVIIGYSSFMMLVIRSNADTPINENNPTNAVGLLSYLNREQYGDWPILSGQYYSAPVIDRKDAPPLFARDDKQGKYVVIDERKGREPVYDPRFTTFFPRMWSNNDPNHVKEYQKWANIKGEPIQVTGPDGSPQTIVKPTFGENLTFFWRYQVLHMYWRYFMWNFVGKQNDLQGLGNNVDGNWISGISFIDSQRLGPQDIFPENKTNKGTNKFYFLPFILGFIGLYFHFKRKYEDGIIVLLLFIMTGIAIVVYLNQYAPQPRERDYAFAASFYAFAIWIGLGVLMVIEWLQKIMNPKSAALLATGLCTLLVPCIMAKDGWNDHDRSGRYAALTTAVNFLESCDKDAILFTVGDNDTFPLWYAQEVEGIRRDVRVVNLSLLSGDWYINQMRKKVYESAPLPITLRPDQYRATNREVTYLIEQPNIQGYEDLKDIFDIIVNHEEQLQQVNEGVKFNFIPTKSFSIKVDTALIRKSGMVPVNYKDSIVTAVNFKVNQEALMRSDLIVLDIIAHNNWKRPIYFSSAVASDALQGLSEYTLQEGIAFRLVPVHIKGDESQPGGVNTTTMYHNLMDKFLWKNLNNPNVYLDETCRRLAMNYRNAFGRMAVQLINEGQNAKAVKALDFCMKTFPEYQLPYDYFTLQIAFAYAKAGETKKAADIWNRMVILSKENIDYQMHSKVTKGEGMDGETQQNMYYLQKIVQDAGKTQQTETEKKVKTIFEEYYNRLF
jgi:tetratricopeptide (TPR) repeat protein